MTILKPTLARFIYKMYFRQEGQGFIFLKKTQTQVMMLLQKETERLKGLIKSDEFNRRKDLGTYCNYLIGISLNFYDVIDPCKCEESSETRMFCKFLRCVFDNTDFFTGTFTKNILMKLDEFLTNINALELRNGLAFTFKRLINPKFIFLPRYESTVQLDRGFLDTFVEKGGLQTPGLTQYFGEEDMMHVSDLKRRDENVRQESTPQPQPQSSFPVQSTESMSGKSFDYNNLWDITKDIMNHESGQIVKNERIF